MAPEPPFPDPDEAAWYGPEHTRRSWELICRHGNHGARWIIDVRFECADASTAERLATHLQAAFEQVELRQREPSTPSPWEIVAHTGVRPLTEDWFFSIRQLIADAILHFRCHCRSFNGRAA